MNIFTNRLCRKLIVLLFLIIAIWSGATPTVFSAHKNLVTDNDEAALQSLAQQFFISYANKDINAWHKNWSAAAQNLDARIKQAEEVFAHVGTITIQHFTITKTSLQKDKAVVRVALLTEATDNKTGKAAAGFGKWLRTLFCVKENEQWKVVREIPTAREIAEALLDAPNEAARATLLTTEKDFVNTDLAQEIFQSGTQFMRGGKNTEALNTFKICRALAAQIGDQLAEGRSLSAMGSTYSTLGEFNEALLAYQQSLQIARAIQQPQGILANLNNIAGIQAELHDYDQVLSAFYEALQISKTINQPMNTAIVLNNIANVYLSIGNYGKALENLYSSLEISKKTNNASRQGIVLDSLGAAYLKEGNLELAESSLQQSLSLLRQTESNPNAPNALTSALINMGHVQKRKGLYEKALAYYEEAAQLAAAQKSQPLQAIVASSMGEVYYLQKNIAAARNAFERSLTTWQKLGQHAGQGLVLMHMGRVALEQAQPAEALQFAKQSSTYAEHTGNLDLLWDSRLLEGFANLALKQPDAAQKNFSDSINAIENMWLQLGGGEQQQQFFFGNKITPYQELVKILLQKQQPAAALEYAEQAKARTLLEVLQSGRVNITHAMTPPERAQEQQLKNNLVITNALLTRAKQNAGTNEAALEPLHQRLHQARMAYETFQSNLYAAHPDLRIKRGLQSVFKLDQALQILPDATSAMLEFVSTDDKTFLFVITREGSTPKLATYELPIATKPLMERVQNFRAKLAQHDLLFAAEAEQLYRVLLEPAKSALRGKTKLIIVPDGELWAMPFEALKAGANRFLIEDFEISRAPSLTALLGMRSIHSPENNEGSETLLALGNPKFNATADKQITLRETSNGLSPLPETEAEVKTLSHLYGANRSKLLLGAGASEQEFKAEASKYKILHVATHSVFNDANPMYSHLVLAQPETAATEDGLLEAWEILQLDLHADLVVLSACETARGNIHAGEGVLGLVWALFIAGTPTTVVSQWKVNSVSTSELMLAFHRELQAGTKATPISKATALRQAALKLLRSKQYHHPFYWASFVLIGDQR